MWISDEMLFLLMTIKHETDISSALFKQLGFSGIGRLCIEAQKAELIIQNGSSYQLTDKGRRYIKEQNDILSRKGLDREIAKLPAALCPKIALSTIYLPEDF